MSSFTNKLMHMIQCGKKSGLCKKNLKWPITFFVTKATDLKIIFLKSPKKMYVKPVTIGCQFRKNTFLPFLDFDSTFPSAQTINVISLIFFYVLQP